MVYFIFFIMYENMIVGHFNKYTVMISVYVKSFKML